MYRLDRRADYPGTGVNQPCRFSDPRYFWDDGQYKYANEAWIGTGGDWYILKGSIAAGGGIYRIGWDSASYCSAGSCWGPTGDVNSAYAPPPPSGTAANPTRILGENSSLLTGNPNSCHAQGARAQLHGGYGVGQIIDLGNTSYVTLDCLDLTDFAQCQHSVDCPSGADQATYGIHFNNTMTHATLNDVRIHGLSGSGIIGPSGDGLVMTYTDIVGNAGSGWNADAGDGQTGTGSALIQHFSIQWNGFAEEYPIVDSFPYIDGRDDSSPGGGYGDGFGTASTPAPAPGWQVHFDQGLVAYNTQDGLDALHLTGGGSSMAITRVLAYGNMGQQIKVGGAYGQATNNVLFTNCNALRNQIPGTPTDYNSLLTDFCRAGEGIHLNTGAHSTLVFTNNTIYGSDAGSDIIPIACDQTNGPCDSTSLVDFRNNAMIGFTLPNGGGLPALIYDEGNYLANPGSHFSNNLRYNDVHSCPSYDEISGLCVDPLFTDETYHAYGFGNGAPLPGSPLIGTGTPIASTTVDFLGNARSATAPTIGAYEYGGQAPPATPVTPTAESPRRGVKSQGVRWQ